MYALGRDGPPPSVRVDDRPATLDCLVKHDFWAATAFYRDVETGDRLVVKFGRSQPLLGLPMRWAGQWLTKRESRFYQRLADVPYVPRWLGLTEPPWIGFAHAFAPGRPMSDVSAERLDAQFFAELERVLSQLHDRGIAYVDLNKPQNVIVGDDVDGEPGAAGRPYLIDFQISYDAETGLKRRLLPRIVRRALLAQMIRADGYHLLKHKKRRRPDLLTDAERQQAERRAWFISVHRTVFRPYFFVRRRLLGRLRRKGRLHPEMSK